MHGTKFKVRSNGDKCPRLPSEIRVETCVVSSTPHAPRMPLLAGGQLDHTVGIESPGSYGDTIRNSVEFRNSQTPAGMRLNVSAEKCRCLGSRLTNKMEARMKLR